MTRKKNDILSLTGQTGAFILGVLRNFKKNQGLLLSGAVAYYTLLSIVPMLILTLIVLSHVMGEETLFHTVATHLEMIVPGYAEALAGQVKAFLLQRQVIGIVGFVVMLFFSSVAFTVLENAMSVIFFHRVRIHRRHFIVSAIIPYIYIVLLGVGVLIVSFIAGALETVERNTVTIFGWDLMLEGASKAAVYILGMIGEVLMLTSLYLVMPVGRITFRHALVGGVTATVLWEITRRILVWYYSRLSLVNVIYGSFGTAVVVLLSIEIAAVILLLGAQVIADIDRGIIRTSQGKATGFTT